MENLKKKSKWEAAIEASRYRQVSLDAEEDLNRRDKARYFAELKEKKEREEHIFGYCPKCFCLIRLNGKCDNCD